MTHFERDFYAGTIPDDALNAAWWRHRRQVPGDRPAGRPARDPLRRRHQDAHQRRPGAVLRLRDRHRPQVPAPRPHRPRDPQAGPARVQLLRQHARSATSSAASSRLGATRDWNAVLREATGEGLSARPMVAYFEPLPSGSLERIGEGRGVELSGGPPGGASFLPSVSFRAVVWILWISPRNRPSMFVSCSISLVELSTRSSPLGSRRRGSYHRAVAEGLLPVLPTAPVGVGLGLCGRRLGIRHHATDLDVLSVLPDPDDQRQHARRRRSGQPLGSRAGYFELPRSSSVHGPTS